MSVVTIGTYVVAKLDRIFLWAKLAVSDALNQLYSVAGSENVLLKHYE